MVWLIGDLVMVDLVNRQPNWLVMGGSIWLTIAACPN